METKDTITPSQYFENLKNAKQNITTDALKNSYSVFINLAEKYAKLGQTESLKKLNFLADVLSKEEKLIEIGVTTFVYKDVIEDYIENVADKTVKIIEMSRYMREIPDDLVEVVDKTKELFDEFYVVFTDYTGQEERKVDKERRDKDPILFGAFKNGSNVSDRFYFLGDWVDEYCDLTLDKLVAELKENIGHSPANEMSIPQNSEELLEMLKSYKIDESKRDNNYNIFLNTKPNQSINVDNYRVSNVKTNKQSFFDKVRSIFKRKE